MTPDFLLLPYRVLDLTGPDGWLCAKILADLGADVVKIEPPGGDPGRYTGPFYDDDPHPDKSLPWLVHNLGKRGVVLDIKRESGRQIFRGLARQADFVIESFRPGYLDQLGLGYDALSRDNPRLVMTSITPFGQNGPHRDWRGGDLVSMAAGGFMFLTGDADRPPVRISLDQAALHASAEGAVASLIADHERRRIGLGQHVDVSIQASLVTTTISAVPYWDLDGTLLRRRGAYRVGVRGGGKQLRQQWPCLDGYVSYAIWGGLAGAATNRALVRWMNDTGMDTATVRDVDWAGLDLATVDDGQLARIETAMARFFLTQTKAQLYDGARERRIQLYPVHDVSEVMASPQLAARKFWVKLADGALGESITYPGAFAVGSADISLGPYRRAPRIGEHNAEILGVTGLTPPKPEISPEMPPAKALQGLKVLEFAWVMAGPITAKYLADNGATVIRVESMQRPDLLRVSVPYAGGVPDVDGGGLFAFYGSNKLSLFLNLRHPEAMRVLRPLIAWADVMTENFAPGKIAEMGLGYDCVRAINPDIIMAQLSIQGQNGPHHRHPGYGVVAAGLAGVTELTGWADRDPSTPVAGYTDLILPRFAAVMILAALEYKRRTGLGQCLDLNQLEATQQFLATALLDYGVNGRIAARRGNQSAMAVPHQAYRCRGDDRWVVISATGDDQWRALCQVIGMPEMATRSGFRTLAGRRRRETDIDAVIGAWTRRREAGVTARKCQAAGVPAAVVQNAADLLRDPGLQRIFWRLERGDKGPFQHLGQAFQLSRHRDETGAAAPLLGQHTEYVCRELLGMSDTEFLELLQAGVFE